MARHVWIGVLVLWCVGVVEAADEAPAEAGVAAALWKQMRTVDVDSPGFKAAQQNLESLLESLPTAKRTAVATAMMDARAGAAVSAAAVELFGPDPLPLTDVQAILWDGDRSRNQRELLKTYYALCRAEAKSSALTEATRRQLVGMLAQRLENLAAAKAGYGEQRLLTHLTSSVLSRYARRSNDVAEMRRLMKAMAKYAEKADRSDGFGAAIPVWLDLASSRPGVLNEFGKAVRALGHWDPLQRLKAAAVLGEQVASDEKAARVVLAMLNDPREEARAAAVRVFAFAKDYRPEIVVPRMMTILTRGRGVIVQEAAADVLVARAEQATAQIEPLLAAFEIRRVGSWSKRASNMLLVLSGLVKYAAPVQKQRILSLAVRKLAGSPKGALAVMEAMGPEAQRAVPSIREFRATADRFQRAYIDRHVLPAILPEERPRK